MPLQSTIEEPPCIHHESARTRVCTSQAVSEKKILFKASLGLIMPDQCRQVSESKNKVAIFFVK